MFQALKPRPWICARCLVRARPTTRRLATAATAPAHPEGTEIKLAQATHSPPGVAQDDANLRKVFDSPSFWNEFSQQRQSGAEAPSRGLVHNRHLTGPDGFQTFARVTVAKARRIVEKVLHASTVDEYRPIARELDRLSDLLCRVIDLSDFVRSTHPDRHVQAAASQAYAFMFEYMNVLNTTTELNDQLQRAMANPEVTAAWTDEEHVVAQILIKDFSKSAIDLPSRDRQRFIDLSNEISRVGVAFVDQISPEEPYLAINGSKLKGMDPVTARQYTRWGTATLPSVGSAATLALRSVEDESVRKEIYLASRTAARGQIDRLEQLLQSRAELATLSGYESYAHMALSDKMAKSPESVSSFLNALTMDNEEKVDLELSQLRRAKQAMHGSTSHLEAWDKDYFIARQLEQTRSKSRTPDFLAAYFSLGTVMQGISRLTQRLYGVRLVPREPSPGETWNGDVRRLDVLDEDDGHIAVVYCDLFQRAGKNPNPAHFTLRCSRQIFAPEMDEARALTTSMQDAIDDVTDGMAWTRDSTGQVHQLPTIALICDFSRGAGTRPTLLSFAEVQTLFHEMGHAIHSMLGRTALQNVSGTRCATDFAELPSVLMERFASAPEVLALYARHWDTDARLPYAMVADRVARDRRFDGLDTEAQLVLAALDQQYHSAVPLSPSFNSTSVYHDVYNRHSSLPEPDSTRWQGFFGHLFGYGATYYSYLFDRAIAGKIWRDVFGGDASGGAGEVGGERRGGGGGGGGDGVGRRNVLSREAGARFRSEVLKWGGARDGWTCVARVLDRPDLTAGGERAMESVGKWGVGS